ncbi:helix-turn-helix domain-containing protein [Myxococcus xanthus]|uniref:helix-turn-helix domain-containing protein n=1 Tax=Myxococcus xanthus TaxID=34 RepID=UPI00191705EE|nr:helix-turn-helix domain-containing protein [Myxococcus xanthus]
MTRRRTPDPLAKTVGARIRQLREESGLTMEKLAYESDLGSKGHLSDIEKGLARPPLRTLKVLADHLGGVAAGPCDVSRGGRAATSRGPHTHYDLVRDQEAFENARGRRPAIDGAHVGQQAWGHQSQVNAGRFRATGSMLPPSGTRPSGSPGEGPATWSCGSTRDCTGCAAGGPVAVGEGASVPFATWQPPMPWPLGPLTVAARQPQGTNALLSSIDRSIAFSSRSR